MKIESYLSHIKDLSTKETISRFADSLVAIRAKGISYCSDFLNPVELNHCLNLLEDEEYEIIGGTGLKEYSLLYIMSDYHKDTSEYFSVIRISNLSEKIKHRDVLGAILSLGIERRKIGDINIVNLTAYVVVKRNIESFIFFNLDKIGRKNVKVDVISEFPEISQENREEIIKTVSSLRIDAVIASLINLSRSKCDQLISSEKVKLNYEICKTKHFEVTEGDIISIRGNGRFVFKEILGISKKQKYRVLCEKFI